MSKEVTVTFYNENGIEVLKEVINTEKYRTLTSVIMYANFMCDGSLIMKSYKIII